MMAVLMTGCSSEMIIFKNPMGGSIDIDADHSCTNEEIEKMESKAKYGIVIIKECINEFTVYTESSYE